MTEKDRKFRAYRIREENGKFTGAVEEMKFSSLEQGEVLIRVHYSSLNYKDALSASGNRGVTRRYPHTPGIDAAGIIEKSNSESMEVDEKVIVTGYDLGMNTDGGFAEYIRVPSEWVVKLPAKLSLKEAMIYGTAGFTAGISVMKLTDQIKPGCGKIAVSGATGGVGSLTISILSKLGYHVAAITGKASERDFLLSIGAKEIILRDEIDTEDQRALLSPVFAGAVDTVGGSILEYLLRSVSPGGVVTSCGNVASHKLELTVYPFILRAASLMGIASQNHPMPGRIKIWELLSDSWKPAQLADTCTEITLEGLPNAIDLILQGKLKGRTVVALAD